MSLRRENVLVYLSNAVERYCRQAGISHTGIYHKWASYGFAGGRLILEEYYPNATADTYKGVPGFIYTADTARDMRRSPDIPFSVITERDVRITGCEAVHDAYDAIMLAAESGKIIVKSFEENSGEKLKWIRRTVTEEYKKAESEPEYRAFLKAKFPFVEL